MTDTNPIPTQQETLDQQGAHGHVHRFGIISVPPEYGHSYLRCVTCPLSKHLPEHDAATCKICTRAADAGPRLNERCEWNPVLRVASLDPPRDTDCRNETWWSIGHGDRNFHVCDSCAKLPEFKLRSRRDPINANPAATASPTPAESADWDTLKVAAEEILAYLNFDCSLDAVQEDASAIAYILLKWFSAAVTPPTDREPDVMGRIRAVVERVFPNSVNSIAIRDLLEGIKEAVLYNEMERDAMIETIRELEKERDQLRDAATGAQAEAKNGNAR